MRNMRSWTRLGMLIVAGSLGISSAVLAETPDDRRGRPEDRKARPEEREDRPDERKVVGADRTERAEEARKHLAERQEATRKSRITARKDVKVWRDGRKDRAAESRREVAKTWGGVWSTPAGKAELTLHADRMAKLNRILDVANDKGDTALATRTQAVIDREIRRDANVLQDLKDKAGVR